MLKQFTTACPLIVMLLMTFLLEMSLGQSNLTHLLSYQGRLTTPAGEPVEDGTYSLTFRIYDDSTAGSLIWSENHPAVTTSEGLFNVYLGGTQPVPLDSLSQGSVSSPVKLFLETQVETDPPISPRTRLGSQLYSAVSQRLKGDIETGPGNLTITNPAKQGEEKLKIDWGSISFEDGDGDTTAAFYPDSLRLKNDTSRTIVGSGLVDVSIGIDENARLGPRDITVSGPEGTARLQPRDLTVSDPGNSDVFKGGIEMEPGDLDTTVYLRLIDSSDGTVELTPANGLSFIDYIGYSSVYDNGYTNLVYSDDVYSSTAYFGTNAITLFDVGPDAEYGFTVESGGGVGTKLVMRKSTSEDPIETEMIEMSLRTDEPLLGFRPEGAETGSIVDWGYTYDDLNRLTNTRRCNDAQPGDSSQATASGLQIFAGNMVYTYDNNGIQFTDESIGGTVFQVDSSGGIYAYGGGVYAMDATVNVGIGTDSPTHKLEVIGDICATGAIGPCSDARFKKNVEPIRKAVEKILRLQGVNFNWRADEFPQKRFNDKPQIGFIAQDIEKVIPEVVSRGNDGSYMVDYGRLTAVLVEAVKKQQNTIDRQNGELDKLRRETIAIKKHLAELKTSMETLIRAEENKNAGL